MPPPLGFFLTWTTHGTWLPGDLRGWVDPRRPGIQQGDPEKEKRARKSLRGDPVLLGLDQRIAVNQAIRDHCAHRTWPLHALNVRSNHVHVVVTADLHPDLIMTQLKTWGSRRLNKMGLRRKWWTEHGSTRWINSEESFWRAVEYVTNCQ